MFDDTDKIVKRATLDLTPPGKAILVAIIILIGIGLASIYVTDTPYARGRQPGLLKETCLGLEFCHSRNPGAWYLERQVLKSESDLLVPARFFLQRDVGVGSLREVRMVAI